MNLRRTTVDAAPSLGTSDALVASVTNPDLPTDGGTPSLSRVLQQSEDVKALVMDSARGLSAVNTAIKQALETRGALPASESALRTSEAVHVNMRTASLQLSNLIGALEIEIRDRDMLDHRFAAAVEQEQGARHASLHDALTGLPNRALFSDRLEHGLAQAERYGWTLALMFVDLDDFKTINDQYGHTVGDSVLQTIARRLRDNTRRNDSVSRHGGDEFLYLAMGIQTDENASLVAEKIIKMIQAPCNVSVRTLKSSIEVTASIGISIFPRNGTSAEMLIRNADNAMYQAKQAKSGYQFSK